MCRWLCYLAEERALIADVIVRPKHSIVKQISNHFLPRVHRAFLPSDDHGSANLFSNVDGFGISFYTKSALEFDMSQSSSRAMPAQYKTVRPPLNDLNLVSLSENIASSAIMAHIRAATGLAPVTDTNCHPFVFGRFSFAHNGKISRYFDIRLKLLSVLSPIARAHIRGTTDTEHIAALYFTNLEPEGPWTRDFTQAEMESALRKTIADLQDMVDEVGGEQGDPSHLNFGITDGEHMIATRYAWPPDSEPPSLYWSTEAGPTLNTKYEDHPDGPAPDAQGRTKKTKEHGKSVIVASEPITYHEEHWHLIPRNHMVSVAGDMVVRLFQI